MLPKDVTNSPSDRDAQQPPTAAATEPADRSRGGAPLGNRNRWRHGLRSPRGPKGSRYVDMKAGEFRRFVEDAVLHTYGEISVWHASLINTAAEAARVAMGELADLAKLTDLKPTEVTAKRQSALKACMIRDDKLKQLGIVTAAPKPTADGSDPWAAYDAKIEQERLAALAPPEPTTEPENSP